jgi:hypothetical protein
MQMMQLPSYAHIVVKLVLPFCRNQTFSPIIKFIFPETVAAIALLNQQTAFWLPPHFLQMEAN